MKRMLQHMVDEAGRKWNLLLTYILFIVPEMPQASTVFTPFKGCCLRGDPSDFWMWQRRQGEKQPFSLQEVIKKVAPFTCWYVLEVQAKQSLIYDCPAQPQEFHPGKYVFLLLPSVNCMFLACW